MPALARALFLLSGGRCCGCVWFGSSLRVGRPCFRRCSAPFFAPPPLGGPPCLCPALRFGACCSRRLWLAVRLSGLAAAIFGWVPPFHWVAGGSSSSSTDFASGVSFLVLPLSVAVTRSPHRAKKRACVRAGACMRACARARWLGA
eukprot:1766186-Alexandrium_andersonii.AAC.1